MKLLKIEKDNCRPCHMATQYLNSKNVEYEVVNINKEPEVIEKYNLTSVPVFLMLDESGEVVERVDGFVAGNTEKLDGLVNKLN